ERTFRVVAVRRLKPVPRMTRVIGDSETQTMLAGGLAPNSHDVFLRPNADGVPVMMLRVIAIKIVVVICQADEIARACLGVQLHERFGIPILRFPDMVDVLKPELRRMPVV